MTPLPPRPQRSPPPRRQRLLTLSICAVACFVLLGSGVAHAGAIVSNGTITLGVNDTGELNFGSAATGGMRGLTFVPTGLDALTSGCPCEGWGAADADPANRFFAKANRSQLDIAPGQSPVRLVSFDATPSTAVSVTRIADRLQVTHEFRPFSGSPNLYEVVVTLQNIGSAPLTDVRYTRLMDWDTTPTPFHEYVTIRRGSSPDLRHSDDNGFADNSPLGSRDPALTCPECDPKSIDADVTDSGPADHGALFDFAFGTLAPGASRSFSLFYGAAADQAGADAAVRAASAQVYSYAQTSTPGGARDGTPTTFIFAFNPSGPQVGRTVVARVVSGDVRFRKPGDPGGAFRPLRGDAVLPVGSVIDARSGRLALTSVAQATPGGAVTTQTADFYDGIFQLRQRPAARPVTDIALQSPTFAAVCGTGGHRLRTLSFAARAAKAATRRRRSSTVVARLWGNGKGHFRTRSRNSAATVRGTIWLTEERCDGTLTFVRRGVVSVRDLRRHRTVRVRAGHSYLARRDP